MALASPAAAQVGAAISVLSDDRFRGYSLSDSRPTGNFDLSYDAPGGLYGAFSGIVVLTRHDGLQPLGLQLNGGYARRLSSGLTLDLGIVHSNYSSYSSRGRGQSYTELYAGLGGKILSSRIYVSPDYLKRGGWTLYSEVDANVPAGKTLRVSGQVGMLVQLEGRRNGEPYRPEFDWRLGFSRDFGRLTGTVAWTGTGPDHDLYQRRSYGRSAFVAGVTFAL
ncbi:MAG: TorF family putative porin [Sphingomicrobium sp.]